MIARGYKGPGDVERTMELVRSSGGIARSKELAEQHSAQVVRFGCRVLRLGFRVQGWVGMEGGAEEQRPRWAV